jgi:hypothetical protein
VQELGAAQEPGIALETPVSELPDLGPELSVVQMLAAAGGMTSPMQRDRYAVALSAIYHARPDFLTDVENNILGPDWQTRLQAFRQADEEEYAARLTELRASFNLGAKYLSRKPGAPPDDARVIEERAALDPDLKEDLQRLRLRHQAAEEIADTIQAVYAASGGWPPPPDVVQRFRFFFIGTVQAPQTEDPARSSAPA